MSGEKSTKQNRQKNNSATASAAGEALTTAKTEVPSSAGSEKKTSKKRTSKKVPVKKASAKKVSPTKTGTTKTGTGKTGTGKTSAGRSASARAAKTDSKSTLQTDIQQQAEISRPGTGLAWLALAGSLLALALGGYAAYQTTLNGALNSAKTDGLADRIQVLTTGQQTLGTQYSSLNQKTITANDSQLSALREMEQNVSSLKSTVSSIELASQASTDEIKSSLGESVAQWKLDEVHSLLSRVNQYYQLTGDKARATEGLNLARETLATIDNPRLTPVKAALAEDLLRIESDTGVDTAALNHRLIALSGLIPDLKLAGDTTKTVDAPEAGEQAESVSEEGNGFLAASKSLLDDLGGLVKYRNLDAPLRPSLDQGQRFVLYELLQLKIQTAMVALMRHNSAVYQSQLKLAADEVSTFFDLDQAQTQTVLNELNALGSEEVALDIKPVSGALSSLNKVMVLEK